MVTGRLVKGAPLLGIGRSGVVTTDESISTPTIANPQRVHFLTSNLHAAVGKVVLLDTSTGKLLLTYDVPQSR